MASSSTLSLDSLIQETPLLEGRQPIFKRAFRFILTHCTAACREAILDLRSIRRARAALWSLYGAWFLSLLSIFFYLVMSGLYSSGSTYGDSTACRSDSSFNVNISAYNSWAASGFFKISLGGGNLTFTQAKVIDILWDIILGRGGQVFLAFISWRVFANYVATSMEFAPVTYAVFSTIYLQDEPSIFSTFRIARVFISGRGLKSKLSMVFIILSMLFLVGWPTFVSAMTGYTTIVEAFIPNYDGSYIPYSDFQPIAYIIHDGQRVNLTEDYMVSFLDAREEPIFGYKGNIFSRCNDLEITEGFCLLQRTTSNYVSLHGFFGIQDATSVWMNNTLPSPVLNISAFYFTPDSKLFGHDWVDPRATRQKMPFQDPSNITLASSNQTYPLTYIQSNGQCQPVEDRFAWGFSFIQLFIVDVLLNIWATGIYIIWLKARFQLPLQGQAEVPRGLKSVLILAKKMNNELHEAGIDVHSLTDRKLKDEISKQLQGGSVSLDTPLTKKGYSFRRGIKQWFKTNRRWCLVMLLTSILLFGLWLGFFFMDISSTVVLLPCLFLGFVFAVGVGSTIRSSLLIVLCWTLLGVIIDSGLFPKQYQKHW
ncbi:hypothetical protein F4677DRAFT_403956 [Hypoxylon crocopeplum]|nr:hypothetical protein F4677DRAFT_403956 [Hypoxylon crocopeplum]